MFTNPEWVSFHVDFEGQLTAYNHHPKGHKQQLEVIQFTGLHDVNGVEIYKGDIVSVPGVGNVEVKICPHYGVVYCFPVSKGNYEIPYVDCVAENDFPTIIGNIYQNPELLKE